MTVAVESNVKAYMEAKVQEPAAATETAMSRHSPDAEKTTAEEPTALSPEEETLRQEEEELAIVKELRASAEWHEVVAYGYLSDSARQHSLTASTLRGENKILRQPLKFFNEQKTECTIVVHLGANLCGHDGIIHGGMLATLLDEHLAYVTLPSLPNYTGFTANLSVDYRMPVRSQQWVIVRGKLDRVEGRKAWADAQIESLDKRVLAEARALYISPRADGPRTDF